MYEGRILLLYLLLLLLYLLLLLWFVLLCPTIAGCNSVPSSSDYVQSPLIIYYLINVCALM